MHHLVTMEVCIAYAPTKLLSYINNTDEAIEPAPPMKLALQVQSLLDPCATSPIFRHAVPFHDPARPPQALRYSK